MPEKKLVCWSCKREVEFTDKLMRSDHCPQCDMPLKCCHNCRFYDREAHQKCRESQAEWVRYKEKANLCSYFVPAGIKSAEQVKPPQLVRKELRTRSLNGLSRGSSPNKKKKKGWDDLFND